MKTATTLRGELAWLTVIALLGVAPRLGFVLRFPTLPISDFANLVEFAVQLCHSLASGSQGWQFFGAGMPTLLALVLRSTGGDASTTARLTTAVLTGLVPLLPFLILRGTLPLRGRVVAALLLALWPGQIAFSGVVAQDNWALLPSVALGCLSIRALAAPGRATPWIAGLLLGLAAAIRQELLVALAPLALAAAMGLRSGLRTQARFGVALALSLGLIATQRGLATGRFALTTAHSGVSVLGAYQPGSVLSDWATPTPYLAARPAAQRPDDAHLDGAARDLALEELLHRPGFHVLRALSAVVKDLRQIDEANLSWSVGRDEVLPPGERAAGLELARRAARPLRRILAGQHLLFLAALLIGLWRRSLATVAIALAVLLKIAVHAAIVSQPRYFVPVVALELLVVAVMVEEARTLRWRQLGAAGALAILLGLTITTLAEKARAYALRHDFDDHPAFALSGPSGATLRCTVEQGRLEIWSEGLAALSFSDEPVAGDRARLACTASGAGHVALQLQDSFAGGGEPDAVIQLVTVEGREALRKDLAAEAWDGWSAVDLELPATLTLELHALHPAPGRGWLGRARTAFQLGAPSP